MMNKVEINARFKHRTLQPKLDALGHIDKVTFADFSAEQLIDHHETRFKSGAPRFVIEAAKLFTRDPPETNKQKWIVLHNASSREY